MVIATGLTVQRHAISSTTGDGNELAHQLLGTQKTGYFEADKLAALIGQSPAKAQHVALAIVLGACESVTSKQSWRYPTPTDAAYLTQLATWGYRLSDVERITTNQASSATRDANIETAPKC